MRLLTDSLYALLPIQSADFQDLVLQHVEAVGGLLSAFPAEQHDWNVALYVGRQLIMAEALKRTPPALSGVPIALATHATKSCAVEAHQADSPGHVCVPAMIDGLFHVEITSRKTRQVCRLDIAPLACCKGWKGALATPTA